MNAAPAGPGGDAKTAPLRPIHLVTFVAALIALYYLAPLIDALFPPEKKTGLVLLVLYNPAAVLLLNAFYSAKWRPAWAFPLITAVLFVPSVYVHYNESALCYAIFYLLVGAAGFGVGSAVRAFRKRTTI